MSHFTVMVVTEEAPTENSIGKVLQPYHEFECTGIEDEYVKWVKQDWKKYYTTIEEWLEDYADSKHVKIENGMAYKKTNPNAKWDWWTIGGRWSGFFLYNNGEEVNCLQKKDLDLVKKQKIVAAKSSNCWSTIRDIAGEKWVSWSTIREKYSDDIDKARKIYGDQAAIKRLRKSNNDIVKNYRFKGYDKFLEDQEKYVKSVVDEIYVPFALLLGGKWYENGEMDWFACVSNEKENWIEEFQELFSTIPEEHWLTIVDCHI